MKLQPTLMKRHFRLWAVLFVVLFLACSLAKDVRTPMWTDELLTLYVSQQAGAAEIVKATLEGSDGAPPLYAMMVRAILPVVGHQAAAVRLPATLGYCGMIICLLAFCRRRLPAVYALAAALLACDATLKYSTEGRGYGVVLGCAACALFCWQAAIDGRRRIPALWLLAFSVALMTAMHYYSVFFLVPLFLAEMVRWWRSRKPDFGVLVALAPALVVLGLHYPFIAAAKPFQRHFWSPAVWGLIPVVYYGYLGPMLRACVLPLGVLAVFSTTPDDRSSKPPNLSLPEWVAAGAFLLMPLCVVAVSIYTTHVFVARYALWAAPGFAVLVAALMCRAARGQAVAGVSLLGLLVAMIAWSEMSDLWKRPVLRSGEEVRKALEALPDGAEPIVIPDIHVFMELSYYAERRIRERIIYPISRDLELRYLGTDTSSLLLSALSHRTKLHIIDYDAVLGAHPRFVLAVQPADYLRSHLVNAGWRAVPIGSSIAPVLYEVEAPGRK